MFVRVCNIWAVCLQLALCLSMTVRKFSRWRHQMETFSALLILCAGNSQVAGEFTSQRPVKRSFDVFLWSAHRPFETPSRSLWRHCNVGTEIGSEKRHTLFLHHSYQASQAGHWYYYFITHWKLLIFAKPREASVSDLKAWKCHRCTRNAQCLTYFYYIN